MEAFKEWEKKRNQKIEKKKKDNLKKELDTIKKNNIHRNKKMSAEKMPSMLDRLYTNDIKKRKEKQLLLTQIYTPSFTPFIYTKNNNTKRNINSKKNEKTYKHASLDKNVYNKTYLEHENNEDEDDYNEKKDEDEDNNYFYEKNYLGILKSNYKKMFTHNLNMNGDDDIGEEDEEGKEIVQSAFRDRIFKNNKIRKIKRNQSVEM